MKLRRFAGRGKQNVAGFFGPEVCLSIEYPFRQLADSCTFKNSIEHFSTTL